MGWVYSGRYLGNWFEGKSQDQTGIVAARLLSLAVPFVDGPIGKEDKKLLDLLSVIAFSWSAYGGQNRASCADAAISRVSKRVAYYRSAESYAQTYEMDEQFVFKMACAATYFGTTIEEQWSDVSSRAIADIQTFSRAAKKFRGGEKNFWDGVNIDLDRFEASFSDNHSGRKILVSPIDKQQIDLELWQSFAERLRALDENWHIWIGWFEGRIFGGEQDVAFERALLSINNDEWKLRVREVNRLLLERKRNAIPSHYDVVYGDRTASVGTAEAGSGKNDSIPASDRLVSVRHNQEPFDEIEKSLSEIRDEFNRDHNWWRFNYSEYDETVLTIERVLEEISSGSVRRESLEGRLLPKINSLAVFVASMVTVAAGLPTAIKNTILAVNLILKGLQ